MLVGKLAGMSDREVRQVSLQLVLRGDPPFLHAIHFRSPPDNDKADDLQNRALTRATATALLLFRAHRDLKLFRIRTNQPNGSLVQPSSMRKISRREKAAYAISQTELSSSFFSNRQHPKAVISILT
jgi:hypothetical protein